MLPQRSRRLTARQRSRPQAPPPGQFSGRGRPGPRMLGKGGGRAAGTYHWSLENETRKRMPTGSRAIYALSAEPGLGSDASRRGHGSRLRVALGPLRSHGCPARSDGLPGLLPLFLPARLRSLRGGRGVDTSGVLTMAPWSPWQREPSELSPSPAQSRPAGDRAQPPRGPPGGVRASALGALSRSGKCISHDAPRAGSLWKAPTDRPTHPKPQRPTERMTAFPRGGSARGRYQSRQGARLSSPPTTDQATLRPREPRGTWAWTRWRVLTPLTLCGFATESKRI